MGELLGGLIGFAVVGAMFATLERLFRVSRTPRARGSARVDALYIVLDRLVAVPANVVSFLVVAVFAIGHGWRGRAFESWYASHTALFAKLPHAAQIVVTLLVVDFVGYWIHRLMHTSALWRIHAVHHSSTKLDWLASMRNHPLGEILSRALLFPPVLMLGIDVRAAASAMPIIGIWAIFVHANVPWGFGPLRYVIATPLFHRWHHSSEREARDKNFAGLFPIWDILFGTFHLPRRQPVTFGVEGEPLPEGLIAQLAFPFRRGARYAARQ
jgi:sterol desaturase/sphingolipid hydroxylase (fatty acid hydroxylase superfamily)